MRATKYRKKELGFSKQLKSWSSSSDCGKRRKSGESGPLELRKNPRKRIEIYVDVVFFHWWRTKQRLEFWEKMKQFVVAVLVHFGFAKDTYISSVFFGFLWEAFLRTEGKTQRERSNWEKMFIVEFVLQKGPILFNKVHIYQVLALLKQNVITPMWVLSFDWFTPGSIHLVDFLPSISCVEDF